LIVFTLSLLYSIFYEIWFLNVLGIFPFPYELGIIIFNLSLALIASFFFYFMVVYVPEYNNKKKAISIVKKKISRLIDIENIVTKAIIEKTNIDLEKENYSKENFERKLNQLILLRIYFI